MNVGTTISFLLFVLLLVVLLLLFLCYIKSWFCFRTLPRIWCLEENYEELRSLDGSEVEEKLKWYEMDEQLNLDNKDKDVSTAEEEPRKVEVSKVEDDVRSDYSDERIDMFGTVVVGFKYELMKTTITIEISDVKGLPRVDGPSQYKLFVKIFMESGRMLKKWHSSMFSPTSFATKVQKVVYSDLSAKDIRSTAIRMRLYACERKRRDKLVSESIIGLQNVTFNTPYRYKIHLEQREKLKLRSSSDKADDNEDNDSSLEGSVVVKKEEYNVQKLLVGFCYTPLNSRLSIEIVKGNSLVNPLSRYGMRYPNPFVKVTLCDKNGEEIIKSKTKVCPNQCNPMFQEIFMFPVPACQLDEVAMIIGVYHRKSASRKEIIGWSSVGCFNSSDNEKNHWETMKDNKGRMMFQWHLLHSYTLSRHGFPGAD